MVVSGPTGTASVRPISMYDTQTVGAPVLGAGALNTGSVPYWQGKQMITPGAPSSYSNVGFNALPSYWRTTGFNPMPGYMRMRGGTASQTMPAQTQHYVQETRGQRAYNGQLLAGGQVAGGPVNGFFIQ